MVALERQLTLGNHQHKYNGRIVDRTPRSSDYTSFTDHSGFAH